MKSIAMMIIISSGMVMAGILPDQEKTQGAPPNGPELSELWRHTFEQVLGSGSMTPTEEVIFLEALELGSPETFASENGPLVIFKFLSQKAKSQLKTKLRDVLLEMKPVRDWMLKSGMFSLSPGSCNCWPPDRTQQQCGTNGLCWPHYPCFLEDKGKCIYLT